MDKFSSEVWTVQVQNWIIPISRCPVTVASCSKSLPWKSWYNWIWLTYFWTIILQGYFQMYPVSLSTYLISYIVQVWIGLHYFLHAYSNVQRDDPRQLVVQWTKLTHWQSNNCAIDLYIRQSPVEQLFGLYACQANCNAEFLTFKSISAVHIKHAHRFLLGWSRFTQHLTIPLTKCSKMQLDLFCLYLGFIISLGLPNNGIVQIDVRVHMLVLSSIRI